MLWFCKHSLLRCYSGCMLFSGVSELIFVQCLGCGTDLPLVATPRSSLDRFVFGHGCSIGTLAIHCSGLQTQLLVTECACPLEASPSSSLYSAWVWHGLTFGGDSELFFGQVCLWSRLLNGHPCYLLHLGLWQSQQPDLNYQRGLRGPSGYRSLRTRERCPGLRCCLTSGYGNQLHAGACRAGTRDGHARVLPSPVPLIFPAGFYF